MRAENFVSKINILLSLSVIALALYLALVRMQPYSPAVLSAKNLKLKPDELIGKGSVMLKGADDFDARIFKKKNLFSEPTKRKAAEEKNSFMLLGVSLGEKNLAMIRNVAENKDYYCVEGDRIGGFRVKQILKDKVVLELDGKILEISQ